MSYPPSLTEKDAQHGLERQDELRSLVSAKELQIAELKAALEG